MSSNTARPLFDDALAQGLRVMQPQVARNRVAQTFKFGKTYSSA